MDNPNIDTVIKMVEWSPAYDDNTDEDPLFKIKKEEPHSLHEFIQISNVEMESDVVEVIDHPGDMIKVEWSPLRDDSADEGLLLEIKKEEPYLFQDSVQISDVETESDIDVEVIDYPEDNIIKTEWSPIRDDSADEGLLLEIKKEEPYSLQSSVQISDVETENSDIDVEIIDYSEDNVIETEWSTIYDDNTDEDSLPEIKQEEPHSLHDSVRISDVEIESDIDVEFIDYSDDHQYCFRTDPRKSISLSKVYYPFLNFEDVETESINSSTILAHAKIKAEKSHLLFPLVKNNINIENKVLKSFEDKIKMTCNKQLLVSLTKLRKCRNCFNTFPLKKNSNNLNSYLENHQYKCPLCVCSFKTSDLYWCHINMHTGNKPYKCGFCKKAFSGIGILMKHFKSHHLQEKTYPCNECNYVTLRAVNLKLHIRTHFDYKPFQCLQCKYAFKDRSALDKHVLIHKDEKPFQCPHCVYASKLKHNLQEHLATHTEERPYQCPHCKYSAKCKSYLKRHLRTHKEERPYRCPLCKYTAKHMKNLRVHIMIHKEEKPHKCSFCSFSTILNRDLRCHLVKHYEDGPYRCAHCSYAAKQKFALAIHLKVHQ